MGLCSLRFLTGHRGRYKTGGRAGKRKDLMFFCISAENLALFSWHPQSRLFEA